MRKTYPLFAVRQIANAYAARAKAACPPECDPTMPLLYALARSWAWDAVAYRCQTHPQEAEVADEKGDTTLHWACFGNCPAATVELILQANPSQAKVVNIKGELPLHLACSYRASSETIRVVLEANPAAANEVTLAGSNPLHLLADYGGSAEAMWHVLRACSSAATVCDQLYQRRPIEILNGRKNLHEFSTIREMLRTVRRKQRLLRENSIEWSDLEVGIEEHRTSEFWQKIALLAVAESRFDDALLQMHSIDLVSHPVVLMACVSNALCPPSIQEFAILLYSHQLVVPYDGNLALHEAVKAGSFHALQDLLFYAPDAAKVRSEEGKLPLTYLLERDDASWLDGVGYLMQAYPAALQDTALPAPYFPILWSRFPPDVLYASIRCSPDLLYIFKDHM
ncbi:hypothetical protein FisN_6Lh311 [Fistulifera solaris]|uniref:Uncharacterized protein n=1 Tax=Fistulifera solaris TaxID=1519565 RepID=A0A1Z5J5V8_FISSO|nr:hypothetical protein FisN_6Lh311 [Fistulifera solaris]|eukprot:GAX09319.1 hypothetical protein FisN_6Lh311 [Fistulifera solaris]